MARSFQAQTIIGHRKHSEAQGKHISSSPPLCRQAWPQRSQERGRGADLRGNSAFLGSAPNFVAVGLLAQAGYRLTFGRFMRDGVTVTFATLLVATFWLLVRY